MIMIKETSTHPLLGRESESWKFVVFVMNTATSRTNTPEHPVFNHPITEMSLSA